MPTTAIFLICLMVAPPANSQQAEPLTNSDLLQINGNFAAPSEFRDNGLLYDEKLAEVFESVREYENRPVDLVAVVEYVRRDSVQVTFFPKARYSWYHPKLAIWNPADVDAFEFPTVEQLLEAGLAENPDDDLKIGKHVSLSLAKTLRRGDRLRISGKLVEIQLAPTFGERVMRSFAPKVVAGFLVSLSKVEKISNEIDSQ